MKAAQVRELLIAPHRILLFVILMAASALRFQNLDRTSLWYDEAVSWAQSKGSFSLLLTSVAADNYPPLHNVILWLTIPVLGDSETALRLPSALFGVIAVWLTYLVGKQIAGRDAGLLGSALLAVSPLHIWYSTEARMYAVLAATGLAFLLCVLRVLDRPTSARSVALIISGALFLYSHVFALLGFVSVGAVCAIFAVQDLLRSRRGESKSALVACLAMAASALLFLPWLVILADRVRSVAETGFWIAFPDLQFLETLVFSLSGSLTLFWLLLGLALAGVLTAIIYAPRSMPEPETAKRTVCACLAYAAGPPLLAYSYSTLYQPILFDRYLIAAWPGLIVLAAAGATRCLPRLGSVALVVIAIVLTYPQLSFTLNNKIRPEWRDVAAFYQANREPEDRLLLYKGFAAPALSYYLRGDEQFEPVESFDSLKHLLSSSEPGRNWLLLVHSNADETNTVKTVFPGGEDAPAKRGFGWGASGLTLLKPGAISK